MMLKFMKGKYNLWNHFVKTNDYVQVLSVFVLQLSKFGAKTCEYELDNCFLFFYQTQNILRKSYFSLLRTVSILFFL